MSAACFLLLDFMANSIQVQKLILIAHQASVLGLWTFRTLNEMDSTIRIQRSINHTYSPSQLVFGQLPDISHLKIF